MKYKKFKLCYIHNFNITVSKYMSYVFVVCLLCCSVFAGCQIPYPKREFLNEDEPEEKGDKV